MKVPATIEQSILVQRINRASYASTYPVCRKMQTGAKVRSSGRLSQLSTAAVTPPSSTPAYVTFTLPKAKVDILNYCLKELNHDYVCHLVVN